MLGALFTSDYCVRVHMNDATTSTTSFPTSSSYVEHFVPQTTQVDHVWTHLMILMNHVNDDDDEDDDDVSAPSHAAAQMQLIQHHQKPPSSLRRTMFART